MIIRTLADVTADALAATESTEDPRLRDIMASLVKHLHAFVRDVRLTEPEFRQSASPRWSVCSTMAMAVIRRRRSRCLGRFGG